MPHRSMKSSERERELRKRDQMAVMPKMFSFSHNGRDIVAVLVDDPPAGDNWTYDELCSICDQPLAYFPFYTTDPLLFYIHSHCAYANAAPPPASSPSCGSSSHYSDSQSRSLSAGSQSRSLPAGSQSRHIPSAPYNYPSAPPAPHPYPTNYYYSFPYYYDQQAYNYNYPANYPSTQYHYNQYNPSHAFPANYQTPQHHYNQYHPPNTAAAAAPRPSSSSSSVPGWVGMAAMTGMGSLLQALFSMLFAS